MLGGLMRKMFFALFGNPEAEVLREALICLQREHDLTLKQVHDLNKTLDALRDVLLKLQRSERDGQVENLDLRNQVEFLEERVAELLQKSAQGTAHYEKELLDKSNAYEKVVREAAEAAKDCDYRVQKLQEELALADSAHRKSIQDQKRDLLRHGAELRQIQEEAQKYKDKIRSLEAEVRRLEAENQRLLQEVAKDKEALRKLKASNSKSQLSETVDKLNKSLEVAARENSEKFSKLKEANSNLEQTLFEKDRRILSLEQTLQEYQKGENALVNDVVEFSHDLAWTTAQDSILELSTADGDK